MNQQSQITKSTMALMSKLNSLGLMKGTLQGSCSVDCRTQDKCGRHQHWVCCFVGIPLDEIVQLQHISPIRVIALSCCTLVFVLEEVDVLVPSSNELQK